MSSLGTPYRWALKLFALFILCFVGLAACAHGSDGPPRGELTGASANSGSGGGGGAASVGCGTVGNKRKCHVTIGRNGNVLTCYVGVQVCEADGSWSECGDGTQIQKSPNNDGKPLSLTSQVACANNPCDPRCEEWLEAGNWQSDGQQCIWPWSWAASPNNFLAQAKAANPSISKQPCTYGADCQQNQKCVDPNNGSCSHDICQTGAGLDGLYEPACEEKCVHKICQNKPKCCVKKYTGNCEVEPCLTDNDGMTDKTVSTDAEPVNLDCSNWQNGWNQRCDTTVAQVCAWDKTCCPYKQTDTCKYWGIIGYITVCSWQWIYVCYWEWILVCYWEWILVCYWEWIWVCGWSWWGWFCYWEWVYVCYWEWIYVCYWEWVYVCYWEWIWVCVQEPVYGWIYYPCPHCYAGVWDQHCVDQYNVFAPGVCPMSWPGNWDASCVQEVHDTCLDICTGKNPEAGNCVEWQQENTDAKCAQMDLKVGLTCESGNQPVIPICNVGNTTAPAGIPVAVMPAADGAAYWGTSPNTLPNTTTYCYTPGPIPAGQCINVTTCNAQDGDMVMVNPKSNGSYDSNQCWNGSDGWGYYYAGTCGYPPGCPPGWKDTVKIDNFQASCPNNSQIQWGYLSWDATVPANTEIDFAVRTASTQAALPLAPWINVSPNATPANPSCPQGGPAPCPVDLFTLLTAKYASNQYLDLQVTLKVPPDESTTATLKDWQVTYTCVDNE